MAAPTMFSPTAQAMANLPPSREVRILCRWNASTKSLALRNVQGTIRSFTARIVCDFSSNPLVQGCGGALVPATPRGPQSRYRSSNSATKSVYHPCSAYATVVFSERMPLPKYADRYVGKPYRSGPQRDYEASGTVRATVPVPEATMAKARKLAAAEGVPVGRWLANLIEKGMKK